MRTTLTTYVCDNPECDTTVVGITAFDMGPTDWFQLTEPDGLSHDPDDQRHFCSALCLQAWATNRIWLEEHQP